MISVLLFFLIGLFQAPVANPADEVEPPVEWVCPMDPDVHSAKPGSCSRCGMKLVAGIPDNLEYDLEVATRPKTPKAGQPVQLKFTAIDPKDNKPVKEFQLVHEKLFHLFLLSQDLSWFAHEHPVLGKDGLFRYNATFPKPGMYRVVGDFYPRGGTPQLLARTVIIPGAPLAPMGTTLTPDPGPKKAENIDVGLSMEPAKPVAGTKTLMYFDLQPADGLEQYLGAWGHMLAASSDLVDTIHSHPFLANGGSRVQFNMIFPRPGVYRVWVQFQRKGVVNTVKFDVPVAELK